MQVLTKIRVKLQPGIVKHPSGRPQWWSGWVVVKDGLVVATSPSCQTWMGREGDDFEHWGRCAGGDGAITKTEERT